MSVSILLADGLANFLRSAARQWGLVLSRFVENNRMILRPLCRNTHLNGKLVADVWHAALAFKYNCERISTGAGFSRFDGLRWKHSLKMEAEAHFMLAR